ncbi:hypothetical protein [Streptomyces sp. NPDC088730]|uniref:hypothetical protein n=1 Tax=Streptomyces sp. NPDC088730 TaxID=3365877 RepID=UPI00381E1AB2
MGDLIGGGLRLMSLLTLVGVYFAGAARQQSVLICLHLHEYTACRFCSYLAARDDGDRTRRGQHDRSHRRGRDVVSRLRGRGFGTRLSCGGPLLTDLLPAVGLGPRFAVTSWCSCSVAARRSVSEAYGIAVSTAVATVRRCARRSACRSSQRGQSRPESSSAP